MAGTIADKLTYLDETKIAIKGAIVAKGVDVPDGTPFREYAGKISQIEGGGGETSRFGLTLDTWLGTVDANGQLNPVTEPVDVVLTGVKSLGREALKYRLKGTTIRTFSAPELVTVGDFSMQEVCQYCVSLKMVSYPKLVTIGYYGLSYAFYGCKELTEALFPALTTIDDEGMKYAFYECHALKSISFPALTTIGSNCMERAFYDCRALESVSFPKLTTIGNTGMSYAFQVSSLYPGVLKRIDFPALTDVQKNSFGTSASSYAFRYRTMAEGIHFRADMKETIEAMTGYADKWGATNATIYFDL